ncbi:RsfA family transcriptional regulator [Sutcliffiella rhizosphaerae]|uniref:Prespore-specific transcriptional regulator RsfA n=1 Tax=Sutcliffiella rhizosphaerae TaxID=2880967 RepID=A0ABN8A9X6_9BACI|nr:RsfA family transcriptional regulator [Sutcliffiella rhizosphaerae]CAG9619450.1 Prespore-specific transcriptional regulator RsfA [Sutcliffiella rhizosphaerae]
MKVRQDAWSHEDDLFLAETVLRYIRDGGTQLGAFDEVGDALNRTSAACGFRWNAEVRKKYEPAVAIAKKQRKEKKRALDKQTKLEQKTTKNELNNQQVEVQWLPAPKIQKETNTSLPYELDLEDEEYLPLPVRNATQSPSLTLDDCIHFLQNLAQDRQSEYRQTMEQERLQRENQLLKQKNQVLELKLKELEDQQTTINEDYEMLVQIMNRAKRLTGNVQDCVI